MYCENCGARVREGAKFCASCGAPVEDREPDRMRTQEGPAGDADSRSWGDRLRSLIGMTRKERIVAAATAVSAVIAIVAFALLPTASEEPVQDAYTRQADSLCVAAKRDVAVAGSAAVRGDERTAQTRYAAGIVDAVTSWRIGFDQLEPTAAHVADAKAMDDALLSVIVEFGTLARLAREGTQGEISAQAAATDNATATLESTIADFGLTECAATAITPRTEGN